jgi:hypothetical protein
VPRLCEFYPSIWLTTEEKAQKNLSQGKKNLSQVKKNLSQSRKTSVKVIIAFTYCVPLMVFKIVFTFLAGRPDAQ